MKNLTKKMIKSNFVKMVKNQRGQGMLEYILLVVVTVGLVLALKGPLKGKVDDIQNKLSESINGVLN